MSDVFHDVQAGTVSTVASRKRPRQDSDCSIDPELDSNGNGRGGGSSISHHDQEDGANVNGRPSGSQKRARSESHSDDDLSIGTSSTWRASSPASLRASSNSRQLNDTRSPRRTPLESFIPLPIPPSSVLTNGETRSTNDLPVQTAEQELAQSMQFDQHLEALRRSTPPSMVERMAEEENALGEQDILVDQDENDEVDEDIIQRQTESLELETGSQPDESTTTRRLRFLNVPSILISRSASVTPAERSGPTRIPSDDPSHIFERTQSPSLSESSSVVAARSRLGLVRNPDLAVRGQRMRDQLLRWRPVNSSLSTDNNSQGSSSMASSLNGVSAEAQARPGTPFDSSSATSTSHNFSHIPETSTHDGFTTSDHTDFLREMREIFEPFEPFAFHEQHNDRVSAPLFPSRTVGNAHYGLTRRRPAHTIGGQYDEELSLLRQTLENSAASQSHNNPGTSDSNRSPGHETRPAAMTDRVGENSWQTRISDAAEDTETRREIRRLTTLVDELQESIRSRPSTSRPVDLRNNDVDHTLRHRVSQRLRDPPRRGLIDEDYPLLPPMLRGVPSSGRPTSRSLLDPTLSIGLGSNSSNSSRQSWPSTSEWDSPHSSSSSHTRRNSRNVSPLWNTDDEDDTDTDLFDTPSWASQSDGSRPLSSLFNGSSRYQTTLPRTQQRNERSASNFDQPLLTRLLSTRSHHPLTHSRQPQGPLPPEFQRRSRRESSGLYLPSLRMEEPSLPSSSRRPEAAPMHYRSIHPPRDLSLDRHGGDLENNIPESGTRDTLLRLDPPPRPVEPRISSHGPVTERFIPRFTRPQALPSPTSLSRNNNYSLPEHRPSSTTTESSIGHPSSMSPSNRYNWLRGNEDDSLPQSYRSPHLLSRPILPSFLRPREPSPERAARRNFPLLRNGGESLSDLIRRRTARVDRAPAVPSLSQRLPSPEMQPRTASYRLPRPSSLFGETETTPMQRERHVPLGDAEDVIIPEWPSDRISQESRGSRAFIPPLRAPPFHFADSPSEFGPQRRNEHTRNFDFEDEPIIPPRPSSMELYSESEIHSRATRDRQQLRDAINRRGRQNDIHTSRLIPSTFERTRNLIHRDLLSDEQRSTLERRLRESEADSSRAFQAVDQQRRVPWGDVPWEEMGGREEIGGMEQTVEQDPDTLLPQMHRRRRRLSNAFTFVHNNGVPQHPPGSNAPPASRLHRRSPSPMSASATSRQQSRLARVQSRFRELTDTHGEHLPRSSRSRSGLFDFSSIRAGRHRELEEYFRPRRLGVGNRLDDFHYGFGRHSMGDYVRDEDFDASYENLIRISSIIGDARPRGTPSHLLASLPGGFYKDFRTPDCETRCPICLDDYKDLDPVLRISDCDHWFHKDCLEQWLKNARTCPLCKAIVRGKKCGHTGERAPSHDAPGPSRRDDNSDDEGPGQGFGQNNRRSDSPGLTLDELSTFANSSW